jgi:hypothetical protein
VKELRPGSKVRFTKKAIEEHREYLHDSYGLPIPLNYAADALVWATATLDRPVGFVGCRRGSDDSYHVFFGNKFAKSDGLFDRKNLLLVTPKKRKKRAR